MVFMKTKNLPQISEAEWKVMDVVWDHSPQTAHQIVGSLRSQYDWSPRTIKTLIHRLVKKGVLTFEEGRREYSYIPVIEKSAYVSKETNTFLDRLFNGAAAPMVAHFVRTKKISSKEAQEIKKLLSEIEGESQ